MSRPTVRDSRIPCRNCSKGTLYWNPEEKIYVCTECGIQEAALKTWIDAAEYRQKKKKRKRENDRQWALDILGVKDILKKPKKSKKEEEWADIIEKISQKDG